jgi:hypothetical protein
MTKLLFVVFASALLGALLAQLPTSLPLSPGLIGLGLMLLATTLVRQRWLDPNTAPGSPERALWIGTTATALVGGFLAAVLWKIGPDFVMHTQVVHALGRDTWTLVAGAALAHWPARDRAPREDERDRWIAARGLRAGYLTLIALLLAQILLLGFVDHGWIARWSRPGIAHGLIMAILLSVLVDGCSRLRAYAADASAAREYP